MLMQRHHEELTELEFEATTLKTTLLMQRHQEGHEHESVKVQSYHATKTPHSLTYGKNDHFVAISARA